MGIDQDIEKLWNQLFEYWSSKKPELMKKPCQGASEDEIRQLEEALQVQLPEDFLDSFRICNEHSRSNNDEWFSWFGENRYIINNKDGDWDDIKKVYEEMLIYNESWDKHWIPFYDWNGAFYAILNMDNKDNDLGVIYCYDIEDGTLKKWKNDYKEWLEMAVSEVLKYGKLRLETIYDILQIK